MQMRVWGTLPAATLVVGLAAGCYEEHATTPQAQQQPPASAPQPDTTGQQPRSGSLAGGAPGGSARAGAKRAAQNTVDRIGQRQQELEKALEDDQ